MKKIISLCSIIFTVFISTSVNALTIWTVDGKISNPDVPSRVGGEQIEGSYAVLDIIAMVNSYLWFAIGFFCFLFMIWNGYKLITANGDEKVMSSATKALIGCGVGIAICLLAYIIVRVAVKLFA